MGFPSPSELSVDEFQVRMKWYVSDMKREIDKLTPQIPPSGPNAQVITTAGQNAEKGATTIINGIVQMSQGDNVSGAASLIQRLGQLSTVAALLGPVGAEFGAILSLFTGIIATIIDALKPEKQSLEDRLKKVIEELTLKDSKLNLQASENSWIDMFEGHIARMAVARKALIDAKQAGKNFEFDSSTMYMLGRSNDPKDIERLLNGYTLDELKEDTNYPAPVADINYALQYLKGYVDTYSEQWSGLMDQTLGYMSRLWGALHGILGLAEKGSYGTLKDDFTTIGKDFKTTLDQMGLPVMNNVPIFTRWHDGGPNKFDNVYELMYWRIGVTRPKWTAYEQVSGNGTKPFNADLKVCNFAVSSHGTIFSASRHHAGADMYGDKWVRAVRAGRPGTDWLEAKNGPQCEQIFIGELSGFPQRVIVACTHSGGNGISVCGFEEAPGLGEDYPTKWTPNGSRWGE